MAFGKDKEKKDDNNETETKDVALAGSFDLENVELPKEQVGQERVRPEDLQVPRLRLLQGLSQEVAEGKNRAGELIHSITGKDYKPPLEVLLFYYAPSRVMFGEDMGEGLQCQSRDAIEGGFGLCADCSFGKWTRDEDGSPKAPKCSLVHNFPCFIIEELKGVKSEKDLGKCLISISLMKSSAQVANKLLTRINLSGDQWWDKIYKIDVASKTNEKGTFNIFKAIEPVKDASEELRKLGFIAYKKFSDKIVVPLVEEDKVVED